MLTRLATLALASAALIACKAAPISENSTNNPQLPVALLFEHDGCKVYRFEDAGSYRYFAKCAHSASVTSERACGKGCIRYEEIQTAEEESP